MVRVPATLALLGLMALSLAACGSPETTPAAEKAADAAPSADQTPVMPEDAPPQEEEAAPEGEQLGDAKRTCTGSIGAAAATRLAERCTMVSPATHPPCNPDNACALIQDEIDRACGQYGPGETKPAECAA
ncbi:hypothetical protein [Brevundimonas sp. NIBR11]|uniref:hypothetical protein n=1 Tax=Brevundimonas sp. NIBR11 TaxID=3015999 RepID=UPI0022F0F6F7|nr:hypothetical protein [Brevundimonas sp. NIBR11]WGM32613.1 hypothetical protein KKHFBJBL_02867 [Brevundimonas sp. NIBR11]